MFSPFSRTRAGTAQWPQGVEGKTENSRSIFWGNAVDSFKAQGHIGVVLGKINEQGPDKNNHAGHLKGFLNNGEHGVSQGFITVKFNINALNKLEPHSATNKENRGQYTS